MKIIISILSFVLFLFLGLEVSKLLLSIPEYKQFDWLYPYFTGFAFGNMFAINLKIINNL